MRIHALIKRSLTTHCLHFVASRTAKIGSRWIPVLIPVYRYWFFPIPKYRYWEIGPVLQALSAGHLPCSTHHLSYDHCPHDKKENYQNCMYCVVYDSCTQWYAHTYEQFLKLSVGLGLGLGLFFVCLGLHVIFLMVHSLSSSSLDLSLENLWR